MVVCASEHKQKFSWASKLTSTTSKMQELPVKQNFLPFDKDPLQYFSQILRQYQMNCISKDNDKIFEVSIFKKFVKNHPHFLSSFWFIVEKSEVTKLFFLLYQGLSIAMSCVNEHKVQACVVYGNITPHRPYL